MALTNVLLITQLAGYIIGLILSFCIVVPVSLHLDEFNGNCILFSEGIWNENHKELQVTWASSSYCHYVLFVGILSMIICCTQIPRLLMQWFEGRDSTFLSSFLEAVGCSLLSVLVVSAGVIVTLGFIGWCQSVGETFPSCQDLAGLTIDGADSTDYFYVEMDVAQIGTWAAFSTFVGLAVASALKFLRYHQLENIHAVMASECAGEQQPLLNSGWPQDGRSTPPATLDT